MPHALVIDRALSREWQTRDTIEIEAKCSEAIFRSGGKP